MIASILKDPVLHASPMTLPPIITRSIGNVSSLTSFATRG